MLLKQSKIERKFVFVEEKWLYLEEGKYNAILAPDEEAEHHNINSERFMQKVMFLCAVVRFRF